MVDLRVSRPTLQGARTANCASQTRAFVLSNYSYVLSIDGPSGATSIGSISALESCL